MWSGLFFLNRTVGSAKSWLEARLARYGSVLGFAFLGDLELRSNAYMLQIPQKCETHQTVRS